MLVLLCIALMLEIKVIHKHHGDYENQNFQQSYGSTLDGLNVNTLFGRYWNPINFIRWAITNAVMVFLRNNYVAQIFVLLIVSVFFQITILTAKPLSEPVDNKYTLIFEAAVSIYLYILLMLTDFQGDKKLRTEQGWALLILTSATVLINTAALLKKSIQNFCTFIKEKCKISKPKARIENYTSNKKNNQFENPTQQIEASSSIPISIDQQSFTDLAQDSSFPQLQQRNLSQSYHYKVQQKMVDRFQENALKMKVSMIEEEKKKLQ